MISKQRLSGWRLRAHEIIYEADTPAGKAFDVGLILVIIISTIAVMLESITSVRLEFGSLLKAIEWGITILFSVEYLLRLITVSRPLKYATSFYGIIDLLAVLPTYISLVLPGTHYLMAIRALRILRVFRVLRLALYLREGEIIIRALRASRRKIIVFLFAVVNLVIVIGSLMYLVEGEVNGFTSIPRSIYWAIVTMTTVGYGDIAPQTSLGQFLAALVMILGYSMIAVPTGIVTVEVGESMRASTSTQACPSCSREGHAPDAVYCKFCGSAL